MLSKLKRIDISQLVGIKIKKIWKISVEILVCTFFIQNLNFEFWIFVGQQRIKKTMILGRKTSFSLLYLKEVDLNCMQFLNELNKNPGIGLKRKIIECKLSICQEIRENLDIQCIFWWFVTNTVNIQSANLKQSNQNNFNS